MSQQNLIAAAAVRQSQLDERLANSADPLAPVVESAADDTAFMGESAANALAPMGDNTPVQFNPDSGNSVEVVNSGSGSLSQSLITTLKRTSSSMTSSVGDESSTTLPPDNSVFNKQKLDEYNGELLSKSTSRTGNLDEEQIQRQKTDLMTSITKKNEEVVSALNTEFGGDKSEQFVSNILALSSKKEKDAIEPQAVRPIVASSSAKNVTESDKSKLKEQLDKIAATIEINIGSAPIKLSELNKSLLEYDTSTTPSKFITEEVATSILDSLRKTNPPKNDS